MKISEVGKSAYDIVYKRKTYGAQYKSAVELGKYIKLISGAELSIIDEPSQSSDKRKMYVGNFKDAELGHDTITIRSPV